ncbi:MAG: hypothetical protein WB795_06105 [Candidatus Acidiferrales bacterium]
MKMACVSWCMPLLAVFAWLSAATILPAQSSNESQHHTAVPIVTDWSHRHLVFSGADARAHANSPQDQRLQADRRFRQQVARRGAIANSGASVPADLRRFRQPAPGDPKAPAAESSLSRDWTSSLANFGTVGNEQYPAKFEFDINAPVTTANCTSDFVVYNNNNASGTRTGFIADAFDIGIFFGMPPLGSTISITPPATGVPVVFTVIANTAPVTSLTFQQGTDGTTAATNFAAAVNAYYTLEGGVTGTFPYTAQTFFGSAVTITAVATGGADSGAGGNNTTAAPADCFGSGCAGNFTFFSATFIFGAGGTTASVANLIGLMDLYTGPALSPGFCSGSGPTVKFAYGVSTAQGVTTTSPGLSEDGTQIAIVESTQSCQKGQTGCVVGSILHLVKWANLSGSLASPVVPENVVAGNYRKCVAPCMVSITLSTSSDSNSAPFIDYDNDAIYVGDDAGNLREVTGVFIGTPTVGWQTAVDPGFALTGPVYDNASGNIYVADANGVVSTVVQSSGALGSQAYTSGSSSTPGYPIPDPPIVDSTSETVTAFVSNNASGSAQVVQYPIADFATPASATVGPAGVQMHDGDFDNTYYSGEYQYGYLYFCGKNPGTSLDNPAIERVFFNSSGILAGSDGSFLNVSGVDAAECSPVTEVYNAGIDYMFFSVQTGGNPPNCTTLGNGAAGSNPSGGCVMSIIVSDGSSTEFPTPMPSAINSALGEPGGGSGIIIDNVSAAAQASSIYFSPLLIGATSNGNCTVAAGTRTKAAVDDGCAVKATQAGLD